MKEGKRTSSEKERKTIPAKHRQHITAPVSTLTFRQHDNGLPKGDRLDWTSTTTAATITANNDDTDSDIQTADTAVRSWTANAGALG